MNIAEKIAATYADIVYLGVGFRSGYGSAQRMYVKRGYIPDGFGVWYQDKICKPNITVSTTAQSNVPPHAAVHGCSPDGSACDIGKVTFLSWPEMLW